MTVRVLLADDQQAVRDALRSLLHRTDDLLVVGEARDGAEAVALSGHLRPDVVLMDVRMPGTDGIAATREIVGRSAEHPTRVIVLTTFDLDEYVFAALRAGASGFLLKNAPPDTLRQSVRVVAAGQALLDPAVTRRVIERYAEPPRPAEAEALDRLTAREREVAFLIAAGLNNEEIAGHLVISEWTVKTHVRHILDKLGARDRLHVAIAVHRAGRGVPGVGPDRPG
ncbi:response regulator transcription factor [Micromonospora psammae]|uniref:response regulator transcription factor n=1 Tax=Micromonospora sp. CPCC 205556 TaxID=3122398 RepID=UPI002FF13685